jgi:polyhydroxyalkanoate synthesis regulator phasin
MVMVTRDRIEEVFEDAVARGRVTADDAQEIVQGILTRGRQQTNDVLGDLEQLLGRGRSEVEEATSGARKRGTDAASRARKQVGDATTKARSAAREAADPVLAQADRARRSAGIGPSFPILGYDDLTAAQVQARLDGLTPAELRKVRDYEKRHANRKSVLNAIESKLG